MTDVIELTRKLVSFDTVNPPGNEAAIAEFTGDLLRSNGFRVFYYEYEPGRLHLSAEKGINVEFPPVVFSGHFDTVPYRTDQWSTDPLGGEIMDQRIFGRGTCDMKGALAAMIISAIESFKEGTPPGGVRLFFTAGEESGCKGISDFKAKHDDRRKAAGIIVGEPTNGRAAIAHKGAIYMNIVTHGIPAHSSMPHLGKNAIYKAAEAILKLRDYDPVSGPDELLGKPTINIGIVKGGTSINIVPDRAEFTVDVRTNSMTNHDKVISDILKLAGDAGTEILVNLKAVFTDDGSEFVKLVYRACGAPSDERYSVPYLTDGSVLQELYPGAPVVILGPGDPSLAHKNDEYCSIDKLHEAVKVYKEIILRCNQTS